VFVLFQIVNLLDQVNILLHKSFVYFAVRLVCLLLRFSQMMNVLFQVFPFFLKLASQVTIILIFLFKLLLDVNFVKSDNLLLQLLKVANLVQALVHVILELFNFILLLLENC